MTELRGEDYNQLLYSGAGFLLFFYRQSDAESSLQRDVLAEVERLIPKPCEIYCVNADTETELKELFDITAVPQVILIHRQRTQGRLSGLHPYREILQMILGNR